MSVDKIQSLVIKQLLGHGSLTLVLPDGMTLQLGVTQENNHGKQEKVDNYCWVQASQHDRSVNLDSYNVGLNFRKTKNKHICESESYDSEGRPIVYVDVV